MMNSADQQDKENTSLPKLPGMFRNNEAHNSLPPELQAARNNRKEQERNNIPDFTSKPRESSADTSVRGIPDFETFKKQMEANQAFNPFEIPKETPTTRVPSIPTTPITSAPTTVSSNPFMSNSSNDDDFGFDVDELVKKIDAKIAELEAEEKKEEEERKKKRVLLNQQLHLQQLQQHQFIALMIYIAKNLLLKKHQLLKNLTHYLILI